MGTDSEPTVADVQPDDDSDEAISKRGGRDLQKLFAEDKRAEQEIFALLEKRLSGEITSATWRPLWSSLLTLTGLDATTLINWVATSEENRLSEIEPYVPPEIVLFLQKVIAFHGPGMLKAYELANQSPDNWRMIYREVFHDVLNNKPFLRFRIEKYSGEEVLIEGSGDSILGIATQLLIALQNVPREFFREDAVQEFRTNLSAFMIGMEKGTSSSLEDAMKAKEEIPAATP